MSFRQSSIVIAGGGVAGLAAGIRLRQKGLKPLVVEKQKEIKPQIKGEYFQPQGVRVLNELGSLKYFDERKWVEIDRLSHHYEHPLSRRPLEFNVQYNSTHFGIGILHEDILEALRHQYLDLGGDLIEGVQIRDIERVRNGYFLSLSDSSVLRTHILIGADGRFSQTRKLLGLNPIELRCDRVMIAGLFADLPVPRGEFYTAEIPGGVLYAFTYKNKTSRVYVCFHKTELEEALKNKDEFLLRKMRQSLIQGENRLELIGHSMIMPTADAMLPKRNSGTAFWIGDAAGTLDPLGGHGMSVALEDALRVADTIAESHTHLSELEKKFEVLSEVSHEAYLKARFFGIWVGILFAGNNSVQKWAKWNVLKKIEYSKPLRKNIVNLFAGLYQDPLTLLDVPYFLGLLPDHYRALASPLKFYRRTSSLQNQLITVPLRLKKQMAQEKLRKIVSSWA